MKATQFRDRFRNPLLSTAKKDKTWLTTRDPVASQNAGLDPHFSMAERLLLWNGKWCITDDIDQKNMILNDN